MGKKNRQERRAERKEERAEKKEERAKEAAASGNTKRAERLQDRADDLKGKAKELMDKAANTEGATAVLHDLNSEGNCFIKIEWNYAGGVQDIRYDHHEISVASSSPFREVKLPPITVDKSTYSYDSVTQGKSGLIPNIRYVVKVFGAKDAGGNQLDLIGRCIAEKL